MSKKRIQYEDKESDLTVLILEFTYTEAIDSEVFHQVSHRLESLFNMIVLGEEFIKAGKTVVMALAIINRKLTEEEAERRCKEYDEMIEKEEEKKTQLTGVEPKKLWKPHRYSADTLNSLKNFLHDLNWKVGYESWIKAGTESECRPRVRKKYKASQVSLDAVLQRFGSDLKDRIEARLKQAGLEWTSNVESACQTDGDTPRV